LLFTTCRFQAWPLRAKVPLGGHVAGAAVVGKAPLGPWRRRLQEQFGGVASVASINRFVHCSDTCNGALLMTLTLHGGSPMQGFVMQTRFLCKNAPHLTVISVSANIPQRLMLIDVTMDGIPGTARKGGVTDLHSNCVAKPVPAMNSPQSRFFYRNTVNDANLAGSSGRSWRAKPAGSAGVRHESYPRQSR
jgi:hypothetical protein